MAEKKNSPSRAILFISLAVLIGCTAEPVTDTSLQRNMASEPVAKNSLKRNIASIPRLEVCQDLSSLESVIAQARESTPNFKKKIKIAKRTRDDLVQRSYDSKKKTYTIGVRVIEKPIARRLLRHSDAFLVPQSPKEREKVFYKNLHEKPNFTSATLSYANLCEDSVTTRCPKDYIKSTKHTPQIESQLQSLKKYNKENGSKLLSFERAIEQIAQKEVEPLVRWLLEQQHQSVDYSQLLEASLKLYDQDLLKALGAIGTIFDHERLAISSREKSAVLGYRLKPLFCDQSHDHIGFNYHFWAYLNMGILGGGWKEKTFNHILQYRIQDDLGDYWANRLGLQLGIKTHRGTLDLQPDELTHEQQGTNQ